MVSGIPVTARGKKNHKEIEVIFSQGELSWKLSKDLRKVLENSLSNYDLGSQEGEQLGKISASIFLPPFEIFFQKIFFFLVNSFWEGQPNLNQI